MGAGSIQESKHLLSGKRGALTQGPDIQGNSSSTAKCPECAKGPLLGLGDTFTTSPGIIKPNAHQPGSQHFLTSSAARNEFLDEVDKQVG